MLDDEENDDAFPCGIAPAMSLLQCDQGTVYIFCDNV